MHTLTLRTKFTFGDRVQFASRIQQCAGAGKIFAITIDCDRHFDYMIEVDGSIEIQPGIQECEITLASGASELS